MRRASMIADVIAVSGAVLLFGTAVLIVVDVLLRWTLALPINARPDIEKAAVAVAVCGGFPLVVLLDRNISLRFASTLFERLGNPWRLIPRLIGNFVSAGFYAVGCWQVFLYAEKAYRTRETFSTISIPIWPTWAAVALVLALTVVAATVGLRFIGQALPQNELERRE